MRWLLVLIGMWAWPFSALAGGFDVVALGAHGGLEDGNLSAYLVRPIGEDRGVLCDAGTIFNGLEVAERRGALSTIAIPPGTSWTRSGYIAREVVKGYLISHAHLDHVAGLLVLSPDDAPKPIYALASTNRAISQHLFNGAIWPNMGDRGNSPRIGLYHYRDLSIAIPISIDGTNLRVTAYPLSHGGIASTAFLIENGSDALLYLGDTGPDDIEHSHALHALWQAIAPRLQAHRLKAIMVECSYDDSRPDQLLFGHLSPHWLLRELREMQKIGGVSLKGLPVLVTHIKSTLKATPAPERTILSELEAGNSGLGVRFVIAEQGAHWMWR
ncbi:3',5'-cyclic-nucleotide phosphodiesterase [Kozakia baliensis]|uniref:MBL fold metallo-hydrolase n=1 Tax=Kozakia baliensis TaxID=153496 RepID=UPI00345BD467